MDNKYSKIHHPVSISISILFNVWLQSKVKVQIIPGHGWGPPGWDGVTPGDGVQCRLLSSWRLVRPGEEIHGARQDQRCVRQVSWQFLALTGAQGVKMSWVRVSIRDFQHLPDMKWSDQLLIPWFAAHILNSCFHWLTFLPYQFWIIQEVGEWRWSDHPVEA